MLTIASPMNKLGMAQQASTDGTYSLTRRLSSQAQTMATSQALTNGSDYFHNGHTDRKQFP